MVLPLDLTAQQGRAFELQFAFTDQAGNLSLGPGPGDTLHNPGIFTVSTNNGFLTAEGAVPGPSVETAVGADRKLTVQLTAASIGDARVTVEGPCGSRPRATPKTSSRRSGAESRTIPLD